MAIRITAIEDSNRFRDRVMAVVGGRFGPQPLLSDPFPVETAELAALREGRLQPASPEPAPRWQCLIGQNEPEAIIEVVRGTHDYDVVSVNWGELAPLLNEAVLAAERLVGDEDFELRELEVPGLHFSAIHLFGLERSLFLPIISPEYPMPGVEPLIPYDMTELGAALQPHAELVADQPGE